MTSHAVRNETEKTNQKFTASLRKTVKEVGGVTRFVELTGLSRISVWRWLSGKAQPSRLALAQVQQSLASLRA